MCFINAIINSPSDIDLRVSLRTEFTEIELKTVIEVEQSRSTTQFLQNLRETLDQIEAASLAEQFDIFDEEENLDHRELIDRFSALDVDVEYSFYPKTFIYLTVVSDIDDVFNTLKTQTKNAGLINTFLGILRNLLLVSPNDERG